MGRVIFLTGGTGFIGGRVAEGLLRDPTTELLVLVLAPDGEPGGWTPERALARSWWDMPGLVSRIGRNVRPILGDIRTPRLGVPNEVYRELVRHVDVVIHAAADLRLDAPIEALRATNVEGVRHILELAREIDRDHGLDRLVHVSTAYVAGERTGTIEEGPPTDRFGFVTPYERSKYEGEMLVRTAMDELPIAIARPAMVVGDSRSGAIRTFNTVYAPLRLYMTGRLRVFPMRPDLRANIVPIDHVVDAIVRMACDPAAAGATYHLTAPAESLPTARELVDAVRIWSLERLGVRLPRPIFAPIPRPVLCGLRRSRAGVDPVLALLPYFQEHRTFVRDNTDRLIGRYRFVWRECLPNLLAYAARYGFLHRTDRTVHEQILHRLTSERVPITYHDVVRGRHRARDGADLRGDVLAAVRSLRRIGVARGDRVAIVGPNGTRYLTLDLAIGLTGAVAVPVYPTSPPAEIEEIVIASGARVLFMGSPEVLARLPRLPDHVRIVSFARDTAPLIGTIEDVEAWEDFIDSPAAAGTPPDLVRAPVGPDDVATIRYTSGTTGAPKGVEFDHRAIRWMGETMASLVPWTARTGPARYVSFLPMSHVVEGILATYGPAYLPAPVDVWFVEELRDLSRVLPMVRPVVFFGVPRVYEKLWDRFATSSAGRRYLARGPFARSLIRPFVRRGLLRASGLDRCAQLLVGSAPASERLLEAFRELGIEVHEAYGLTEAPLVTLNPVARNRIGTVGVPLPDTRVKIAEDGEVLVRGPQVTRGYVGEVDQPFRDGWLVTGDLGRLTETDALVIEGRRKDLLKTSYGKYVRASRIEASLRDLPGVDEAMIVAEGRPFCTALVWPNDANRSGPSRSSLDAAIVSLNRDLPRPEQIKRWAILEDPPSVATGDMTVNSKLRRAVVLRRFATEIDALYGHAPGVGAHVDIGEAPRTEVSV
ncbi:MAG: AMP-binding protein [Actinomycetota bacterium]